MGLSGSKDCSSTAQKGDNGFMGKVAMYGGVVIAAMSEAYGIFTVGPTAGVFIGGIVAGVLWYLLWAALECKRGGAENVLTCLFGSVFKDTVGTAGDILGSTESSLFGFDPTSWWRDAISGGC